MVVKGWNRARLFGWDDEEGYNAVLTCARFLGGEQSKCLHGPTQAAPLRQ